MMKFNKLLLLFLLLTSSKDSFSQAADVQSNGAYRNNIVTAVPFLLITPEAKAGAMGNAGIAIPDYSYATSLNVSKSTFLPEETLVTSVSYSPWLRSYVPDVNLSYLSAQYKLNDRSAIGGAFRYFSMGTMQLMAENFQELGSASPNELAADISYSRNFGPSFALSGTFRYIYSNLSAGTTVVNSAAGNAVAFDVSALYNSTGAILGRETIWSFGLTLSNIGTKISYGDKMNAFYLPANFGIGSAASIESGDDRLTLALDLNKLMVPTQPIYNQEGKIIKGSDPDRSVPSGTFSSFFDAPGGIKEELKEIGISFGAEYMMKNSFAIRGGYNYQDPTKGNARYFTFGAGIKYSVLDLDVAYLASSVKASPLANTLRFTLLATFRKKSKAL